MMTDRHDGGPAFPGPTFSRGGHPTGHAMGMTLRDYFAGQALAGQDGDAHARLGPQKIAQRAYYVADAMLAARSEAKP